MRPVCAADSQLCQEDTAKQQSFTLVLPTRSDGLNTMRAERKTTQIREERLREQLDAKEKQLADMEVGAGCAVHSQSRAVLQHERP